MNEVLNQVTLTKNVDVKSNFNYKVIYVYYTLFNYTVFSMDGIDILF